MSRALRPSPQAEAAVLAVVQRAQERLPDRDAPLLERLFALECAARGGRAVAPAVERYREALREAEWWIDETWEPDVPHTAVLGQGLSAAKALDRQPPSNWPALLTEALEALERRRQTRFGIGGDPALLAAVLRGLEAADMSAPEWLLAAAAGVLEERRSAEATAELADALARHPSGQALVSSAVSAAFRGDDWADADAPYARWWLASRRKEVDHHLSTRAIDDARLQALVAADPLDGKAAAMVLEAASQAAGQLVITSTDTLSAERSRQDRRVRVALAAYRGAFLAGLLVLGLVFLHDLAHALASAANATNEHPFRQALAGAFAAALAFTLTETTASAARVHGREQPRWAKAVEVVGTVVAGVIAAAVA
jgi:hypothetical protein